MSDDVQILEFELGSDRYCVDIGVVEEIVKFEDGDVTAVPNSPRYIEGVMDLRGQTTKIVDLHSLLGNGGTTGGDGTRQVIVFDDALDRDESMGWAVDSVDRVSHLSLADVEETDDDAIKGIANREDGFLIWTAPDLATG